MEQTREAVKRSTNMSQAPVHGLFGWELSRCELHAYDQTLCDKSVCPLSVDLGLSVVYPLMPLLLL